MYLQASGNTFLHQNEDAEPNVVLSKQLVNFPPVRPEQAAYQTIMLTNRGDTPVQFALTGLEPYFSCKPNR